MRGITIEQLEDEFFARLADLAEFCAESPITQRRELTVATAIYLAEVVKRWQTPGITTEKVVEKSSAALERRMRLRKRKQGIEELKELLGEESHVREGVKSGDKGEIRAARGDKSAHTELEDRGGEADRGPRKRTSRMEKVGPIGGGPRAVGQTSEPGGGTRGDEDPRSAPVKVVDTDEALTIHRQGFEPRHRTPQGDDTDVSERPMTDKMCPKCRASLGPEISNPKAPDSTLTTLRPCPFCGWNPKSPQRPKKGPQPPKAGKSFSGS